MSSFFSGPARIAVLWCVLIMCCQGAPSQGTISGHAFCGDGNRPARFARVLLKPVAGGGFGDDLAKRMGKLQERQAQAGSPTKAMTDDQKKAQVAVVRTMKHASDLLNSSTTGLNGEYSFTHVAPGTYYVHVLLPGYVDPYAQFSDDDFASTDKDVRQRIAASVPMVTIAGNDSAQLDLRLERGAAIEGRLSFEDGSPANGWVVTALRSDATSNVGDGDAATLALLLATGAASKTDDLGQYRLAGLAAGKYSVVATMSATNVGISASNVSENGSGINLSVYEGDGFHPAAAKQFELTAGETRTGVDLSITLDALHSIAGHVYAKADGHPVNSGAVRVESRDDSSIHGLAAIRADGSFQYDYLPAGTYRLQAVNAADAKTIGNADILGLTIPKQEIQRKYSEDTVEVVVSDRELAPIRLTVAETDWKPPVHQPDKGTDPSKGLGGLLENLLSNGKESSTPTH